MSNGKPLRTSHLGTCTPTKGSYLMELYCIMEEEYSRVNRPSIAWNWKVL